MTSIPGFEIQEKLYESSCTLVYRAYREHRAKTIPVILKVLKEDFPRPEEITRYKREYEITSTLEQPHVIRAVGFEITRNRPVVVLEDFGGKALRQFMPDHAWSLIQLLEIAIAIAEGLGEIHAANIIHKDINPSNVVFNPSTRELKIIDFGISTVLSRESPSIKNPDALEGTLAYMSPEQTGRMNRALDYRSDFYSFGVTLYELFTNTLPFVGDDTLELVHRLLTQQPVPIHELNPDIPRAVSAIVSKLLEKTAEERYQSAWGIQADLEYCLRQLRASGLIAPFVLGQHDIPGHFQLPQKLYGRDIEVAQLLDAFNLVCDGGRELMLVAGYSGIGKTCLVHELFKPITKQRGYFISGKFDQLQKNIPYSALVNALQELVKQLLSESEEQLQHWRSLLQRVLGANGQVVVDVIPEVALIIGPQPPVPELPPRESQNRFNSTFQAFIRVFYQPEHPLVIFLDDLQWADRATLRLLEVLLADEDTRYLLLLGAYRDNEVGDDHPLALTLAGLAKQGAPISKIVLEPLTLSHITMLVMDTLHCNGETALPLAELVQRKTGGNPFFIGQFLKNLHQEGLIRFDLGDGVDTVPHWRWDMVRIAASTMTDNVVDLIVGKLKKLPAATVEVLRLAACLGNHFDLHTLSIIHQQPAAATYASLFPALWENMVLPASALEILEHSNIQSELGYTEFRFLHDRVQQAAYALIDNDLKQALHLKIGRLLLAYAVNVTQTEHLFEVVDHLNTGSALISEAAERIELAQLNVAAAKRAKLASAYGAALSYIQQGTDIFGGDWTKHYELTLEMYKERAELEYLNGNYETSEALIETIWDNSPAMLDRAEAYTHLVTQRTMLGKYEEAIAAAAKALHLLGMDFPSEKELAAALDAEWEQIDRGLHGRTIASLINLPPMTDPTTMVVMKVLMTVHTTVYFANNYDLYCWVLSRMTKLSIQYGNVPESAKGYSSFGNTLAASQGKYQTGYEFGLLGLQLAEKYGSQSLKCKACLILSMFLNHWIGPVADSESFDEEGQHAGLESGEFQFIGYILAYCRTYNRFYQGASLAQLQRELTKHLAFTRKVKHNLSTDIILGAQLVIGKLIGDIPDDGENEANYLATCYANRSFAAVCCYKAAMAFALYLSGEVNAALKSIEEARELVGYIKGVLTEAELNFYHSLILAAHYPNARDQTACLTQLHANQRQMRIWAEQCSANFHHQYLLIEAELARLNDQLEFAMERYDQAIEAAGDHGFIQNEALANELAGKFWLSKGKEDFAQLYLRRARQGYGAWGALQKENALLSEYPQLWSELTPGDGTNNEPATSADGAAELLRMTRYAHFGNLPAAANLDLASVMKASLAISSEIVFEKLLDRLLLVVTESAGAQRGSLILRRNGELVVVASINTGSELPVQLTDTPLDAATELSPLIVQYVVRTQAKVVLHDAALEGMFTRDAYVLEAQPKSVLCAPIMHRSDLIGVLYLENNQLAGAFSPSRVELLSMLSSQIAISIQNALLYSRLTTEISEHERTEEELKQAEAKYRDVFDNAAEGIFRFDRTGQLLMANPALATMLGYPSPAELIHNFHDLAADALVSPEQRAQLLATLARDGAVHGFEFHARSKDARIVNLSVTAHTTLDDAGEVLYYEGIMQDITQRRRMEELKIAKEAAEATTKAKGEFLANMSHEIRTPMNAIIGLASLALKQELTPKLRDYLQKITTAGHSLLGIINDILDFSKIEADRLELEAVGFDLQKVLSNVGDLFDQQASEKDIELSIITEPAVPRTLVGDPLRLSQILINLVGNAVKFTWQGQVRVHVALVEEQAGRVQLRFTVQDSGVGMTEEQIGKLFQAFSQADSSTTRVFGGTGLGLTISKKLIELMDGTIAVESTPGKGSTFSCTLTLAVAAKELDLVQAALEPDIVHLPEPESAHPMHILLAEDNAINQQVMVELLTDAGHKVDVACNGLEAVNMAKEIAYDAVLMDIQMPQMDGYEATRRIRASGQRHLPIIATTAHAMSGYRDECLARGMSDYIAKPIDPDQLFRTLARWSHHQPILPSVVSRVGPESSDFTEFLALEPMIDVAVMWAMLGGKPQLFRKTLQRFTESCQSAEKTLHDALEQGDMEAARRVAHTMKGVAGTMAAATLLDAASKLEEAFESTSAADWEAPLGRFFNTLNQLHQHVLIFLQPDQGGH